MIIEQCRDLSVELRRAIVIMVQWVLFEKTKLYEKFQLIQQQEQKTNMKLSKKQKYIFLSFIIVFGISLIVLFSNPLRWSESWINSYILRITPMGSGFDEVKELISKHKWEIILASKEHGFYDQRCRPAKITGAMAIRASLGDYQDIPFEANVTVFWGFNDKEELIDIWVWKTWDGL